MKIGTGWCGYRPEDVWEMLIPDILLAHEGKVEMLNMCFGGGGEETARPLDSADAFDRAFGGGKE